MKGFNKCHNCKHMEKCQVKCHEDSKCNYEEECSDMMGHHHFGNYSKESECCHVPKMKVKCGPTKECVKTYKCCYKLYRFTQYRLYKVCTSCGHEFDHYQHQGVCPKCR